MLRFAMLAALVAVAPAGCATMFTQEFRPSLSPRQEGAIALATGLALGSLAAYAIAAQEVGGCDRGSSSSSGSSASSGSSGSSGGPGGVAACLGSASPVFGFIIGVPAGWDLYRGIGKLVTGEYGNGENEL